LVDAAAGIALPMTDRMRFHLDLAGYARDEIVLGIRPEALRPVARGAPVPSNAATFVVEVVQHLGHETLLDATAGTQRVIARVAATDDSTGGEARAFELDLAAAHLFDAATGANLTGRPARA